MKQEIPWDLIDFVNESNKIEGMGEASEQEIFAHKRLVELEKLTILDLEAFVRTVQPGAILRRQVGLDVRVGRYIAPPGGPQIEIELGKLLGDANYGAPAYEVHMRYETLHPFSDGNGRSGRAVWLWQQGELGAPLGFLHKFYYETLNRYHG